MAYKSIDSKDFNYALLRSDIEKYCKDNNYTLSYVSVNKLYRSKSYLSGALYAKCLPGTVLVPLLELLGYKADRYVIKKEKPVPKVEPKSEPEPAPVVIEPVAAPVETPSSGWECRIRVDEDFETVMMKVLKNGKEMAIARCHFFSCDDLGIMQAISYAAHQCYKTAQQECFAMQEVNAELRSEIRDLKSSIMDPNDTRCFKNWVLKYKNENSNIGKLARYVESVHEVMPSHGERKIRMFFQIETNGRPYIDTFNSIWPLYLKEAKEAERTNNLRVV